MAHAITRRANGKDEFAFVGDRNQIWHGLGQSLTEGADIETWKKEAGMDWDIRSSELTYYTGDDGGLNIFDGKQVLFRSDTREPLSVVSNDYKPVQPGEVLDFFKSLVSDSGMSLSTAGTLFGGKKFWALASTNQSVLLNGRKDLMNGYLLLSTSCDGSMATTAQFTSVRVVCNNTLKVSLSEAQKAAKENRVAVSHRSEFDPVSIKSRLGIYESSWDRFARTMQAMSAVKVSEKDAFDDLKELVCKDSSDPTNAEIRTVNKMLGLYSGNGMGADIAGKTAFGLLNSVTEFWDHHVGRNPSNKLASAFWGLGSSKKQAAMDYLTNKYVEVV